MATRMVWARSAAEIPVVTPSAASMDSVNAVPKRDVFRADMGGSCESVAEFRAERKADQPAAVLGHEVDDFGRDLFGCDGEVAFVFPIFVVDDHQHSAGAEVLDGVGN